MHIASICDCLNLLSNLAIMFFMLACVVAIACSGASSEAQDQHKHQEAGRDSVTFLQLPENSELITCDGACGISISRSA